MAATAPVKSSILRKIGKIALGTTAAAVTIAPLTVLADHYWFDGKTATQKFTQNVNTNLIPYHKNYLQLQKSQQAFKPDDFNTIVSFTPPKPRNTQIDAMKKEEFDVLIVGGGISGTASAHEATSRGLKVALVEKGDFASCTSSRSTKLIHGGIRYLEQAFMQFQPDFISISCRSIT
eukprot:UN03556